MVFIEGHVARQMDEVRAHMIGAWHNVRYQRSKILPSLNEELQKLEPKGKVKIQSPEAAEMVALKLVALTGGKDLRGVKRG